MSDKDMIIKGCEYWIKNHKEEPLVLEYTAVENLLSLLKEQQKLIDDITQRRANNGAFD